MGPEIAAIHLGVLTDVVGFGLAGLDADHVAAHPRGDVKNEFLRTYFDGLKHRPDTTVGTVNSDVVPHFLPDFRPTTSVERIVGSAWPT
jgi:hypothetical protein